MLLVQHGMVKMLPAYVLKGYARAYAGRWQCRTRVGGGLPGSEWVGFGLSDGADIDPYLTVAAFIADRRAY
ncbi:MAG: hypothetical protein JF619_15020 [Massilia sp.]|nr:hypothetical protein [Massilia sp.]